MGCAAPRGEQTSCHVRKYRYVKDGRFCTCPRGYRRAENMPCAKIQIRKRLTMLKMSERRSNGRDFARNSFWRRRTLPGRTPTYDNDDLCECCAIQMTSKLGYAHAQHHECMICPAPNQGCARNTYVSPAKRMAAEASMGNLTHFWCSMR